MEPKPPTPLGDALVYVADFDRNANHELETGALSMETFWVLRNQWSERTFGSVATRGPLGPLKHLAKETSECIAAVEKLHDMLDDSGKPVVDTNVALRASAELRDEIADLLFLVFDVAHRCGLSYTQLRRAVTAKLVKNRARKWGPASSTDAVEHIRESDPA